MLVPNPLSSSSHWYFIALNILVVGWFELLSSFLANISSWISAEHFKEASKESKYVCTWWQMVLWRWVSWESRWEKLHHYWSEPPTRNMYTSSVFEIQNSIYYKDVVGYEHLLPKNYIPNQNTKYIYVYVYIFVYLKGFDSQKGRKKKGLENRHCQVLFSGLCRGLLRQRKSAKLQNFKSGTNFQAAFAFLEEESQQ